LSKASLQFAGSDLRIIIVRNPLSVITPKPHRRIAVMALPFRFNDWWPVFDGPSTGRLMLELFGESEDASTRSVLYFTIRGGNHSSPDWQHKLGIWLGDIGIERKLSSGEKMYKNTGTLFSIDDMPIVRGAVGMETEIRSYSQSLRDKGVASLKVSDHVGYDPLELVEPTTV
jgi:hypothetical protein